MSKEERVTMLANLFGKRKTVKHEPAKIWKTRTLEFEGLLASIEALDPAATRVLVVTHFADSFRALNDLLLIRGATYKTYPTAFEGDRLRDLSEYQSGYILLAPAQALPENLFAPQPQTGSGGFEIDVLVAEHHPLPVFDDRILEFAASLPCPTRVCFHDALDGALLHHFGGDQIAQLISTLKMPDDESVSNPLIDKSIRRAQEKIARRVSSPMTTDSAEQWFQLHLSDS
jgi:hypothetical protein